jgi:hypothetical protein
MELNHHLVREKQHFTKSFRDENLVAHEMAILLGVGDVDATMTDHKA